MDSSTAKEERFLQRRPQSGPLRNRSRRAGPALPSYLALHHAGFSVPPMSPSERWALTPPFHPCLAERAFRRRPSGFPAGCHRASPSRRYILCGTFRDAVVVASLPRHLQPHPLALPGALPFTQRSRRTEGLFVTGSREPTTSVSGLSSRLRCSGGFTPPFSASASDHPAHPPLFIILQR